MRSSLATEICSCSLWMGLSYPQRTGRIHPRTARALYNSKHGKPCYQFFVMVTPSGRVAYLSSLDFGVLHDKTEKNLNICCTSPSPSPSCLYKGNTPFLSSSSSSQAQILLLQVCCCEREEEKYTEAKPGPRLCSYHKHPQALEKHQQKPLPSSSAQKPWEEKSSGFLGDRERRGGQQHVCTCCVC